MAKKNNLLIDDEKIGRLKMPIAKLIGKNCKNCITNISSCVGSVLQTELLPIQQFNTAKIDNFLITNT